MTQGPRRAGALSALVSLLVTCFVLSPIAPAIPKPHIAVETDVTYGTPGAPLTLDVYHPTSGWGYPSLMLIHGGSWKRGDKSDLEHVGKRLAEGGFAVFVPNYRLAPPNGVAHYPMPEDDLRMAWEWIGEHPTLYHGNEWRMAVVGSSAGGHLGMMMAADMLDDPRGPDVVVAFSPPSDLAALASQGILRWAVRDHLGCRLYECPETYAVASPVNRIATEFPPTFLSYGTDELIPLEQGEALKAQLDETKVKNRLVTVEGSSHALRATGFLLPKAMRFIRRNL